MKNKILAALLLSAISAPALADNMYFAADLGSATYENMDPFSNPGKLGLGLGFRINPTIAAELGLTIFGDSIINYGFGQATLSASSFHPMIVGSLPISDQFDLIGKVGVAFNKAKIVDTFLGEASVSNTSPMFGLGAQFKINQQFSLRVQYENFGEFESATNPMSATAFSLGVILNF
jgi:OOP family OmpA-OmpF porin